MARENLTHTSCALLQFCKLTTEDELQEARSSVRMHARDLRFSVVNQTKLMTAASELGRNVLEHGLGGSMQIDKLTAADGAVGMRMTFLDSGPGISDMELAMTDGYTSKNGLGLGLTGSKRLMDEFEIISTAGRGTKVIVTKWT